MLIALFFFVFNCAIRNNIRFGRIAQFLDTLQKCCSFTHWTGCQIVFNFDNYNKRSYKIDWCICKFMADLHQRPTANKNLACHPGESNPSPGEPQ